MRSVAFAVTLSALAFSSGGTAQELGPRVDQIVREYPFPEPEPAAPQDSAESPGEARRGEPLCPCPAAASAEVDADVAFDALVWRYALFRRWLAEIEGAAFDAAAARYAKLLALKRWLENEHAEEAERQFEEEVSLYMLKREFMDRMRRRGTASSEE